MAGSLSDSHPEIAVDFDAASNGGLTAEDLRSYGKEPVWWVCKEGHRYSVSPYTRVRTNGCKICSRSLYADRRRRTKLAKSGSLVDNRPELAMEWDFEQNSLTPDQISDRSHLKVWWICEKGHSWEAAPHSRADSETRSGTGCPTCAQEGIGQRVRAQRLAAATRPTVDAKALYVQRFDLGLVPDGGERDWLLSSNNEDALAFGIRSAEPNQAWLTLVLESQHPVNGHAFGERYGRKVKVCDVTNHRSWMFRSCRNIAPHPRQCTGAPS